MKLDLRAFGGQLAGLAWVAVRTFLATVIVVTLAGCILAMLSYYWLSERNWLYASIAAIVAIIESMALGFVLGGKRAIVMAVAQACDKMRIGRAVVNTVFQRILGIEKAQEFGARGGGVARALERLPLGQAERMLSGAVQELTGDIEKSGWLRRKIQTRLLGAVQKYTLARFRDEDARHDGIDLAKLQLELAESIDGAIVTKVRSGLRIWMALAIIGLPLVIAGQTLLVILLVHSHH